MIWIKCLKFNANVFSDRFKHWSSNVRLVYGFCGSVSAVQASKSTYMPQECSSKEAKRVLRKLKNLTEKRSKQHEALLSYADCSYSTDDETEEITAPFLWKFYLIDRDSTRKKMNNFSFEEIRDLFSIVRVKMFMMSSRGPQHKEVAIYMLFMLLGILKKRWDMPVQHYNV